MLRMLSIAAAALLAAGGCSSDPKSSSDAATGPGRADQVREVGDLIGVHTSKGRKAAPTAAELTDYEQSFPHAVKLIRSGEIVAIWGAKPATEGEVAAGQGGTDIIAYEKKTPTEGGYVLLQNGTVKEMSAGEFASAPKAKK